MSHKILIAILTLSLISSLGCQEKQTNKSSNTSIEMINFEQEKIAILAVLNNETKAACNRDYESWKDKWIQEDYVSKTYMNFTENTLSETLGWAEISDFVKTYIEEHPEPVPIPTSIKEVDLRLYGSGAWVSYQQSNADQGLKRETRLMEKVNGQWKIAGMQTVIYGFKDEE